jgi:hypothetical protein
MTPPWGVRQALANSGIQLSGFYYGEAFGNWGGVSKASNMTACLKCISTPT